MAKSVTLRQGTAAEHAGFTGQMAEVTFDTTNNTVILHDGSTPGGIPMAKLSDVPVDLTDLTDVDDNINTAINIGAFSGTTYVVTVASGTNAYSTGNKYYITDLTDASPTVTLTQGVTYRFDQSDSTNTGHLLKFSTTANGTHDGGTEYTTGVTYNGVPGQADAYTEITVEVGAPALYYYCANHSGMGDGAPASEPAPVSWTNTWTMDSNFDTYVGEDVSERQSLAITGIASQGGIDPWILAYPLQWSDDGYMLYIQGNGQQWIQHGVSTPWDPTSIIDRNATTTSTSTATVPQGSNRLLFRVVDGGDKVLSWRGSGTTQNVYMDTLSTSGDLTSKVNTTTNIWSAQSMIDLDGSYWKIDHMSPDGTKLYVVTDGTSASINATTQKWEVSRGAGTTIIEFTLSTAWDLTTISVTNSQSYSWYTPNRNNWRSVNFTPDGLTVYTMAKESSYSVELKEHNLTTAWDISTASMNSNTLKLFGTNIDPVAATFTGDGTKIHFFDANLVKTIDLEVY